MNATAPKITFTDRFGSTLAAHGFTPLPNLILRYQAKLGLTGDELTLYAQVMQFKWTDALPVVSIAELAERIGWRSRKVQEVKASLVAKNSLLPVSGFGGRSGRRQLADAWDFSPLHNRAIQLAEQMPKRKQKATFTGVRNSAGVGVRNSAPLYDTSLTSYTELVKGKESLVRQQPQTPLENGAQQAAVVDFLNSSTREDPENLVEGGIVSPQTTEQEALQAVEAPQSPENIEENYNQEKKDAQNPPQAPRTAEFSPAEKAARQAILARIIELDVNQFIARQLVRDYPIAHIESQLAALAYRTPRDRAATLVASIKQSWTLPAVLVEAQAAQVQKQTATDSKKQQIINEIQENIRDRQRPLQDRARSAAQTFADAQKLIRHKVYSDAEMLELITKQYNRLQSLDAQQIEEDRKTLARFGLTIEEIEQTI